ncbi:hypothetical protein Aperf_G00000121959 [Anoplocephala perfoliata]
MCSDARKSSEIIQRRCHQIGHSLRLYRLVTALLQSKSWQTSDACLLQLLTRTSRIDTSSQSQGHFPANLACNQKIHRPRSKMTFIKLKKMGEGLREFCDELTAQWLETEILMNKKISEAQLRFWETSPLGAHDLTGAKEYIRDYIEFKTPPNGFEAYPNIVGLQKGKLKKGHPVRVRNLSNAGDLKTNTKQTEEYGLDEAAERDDSSFLTVF